MNLDHDGMAGPVKRSLRSGIATNGHKTFLLSFQRHENTNEMFKNHIMYHNRAVYTRKKKPRLTIAAAYIRREHPV